VKPFETLAETTTAEGRRLTLHRHDVDFFIHLDGDELMSTRRHHSEAVLAEAAVKELGANASPRLLIGGLGLGYTLRAALEVLPAGGSIVVAELFPAVVDWNRKYIDPTAEALLDRRVEVDERDVRAVIADAKDGFDAILLDVDNGPSAWCLKSNERLYGREGIASIHRALRPGGVLGVWSAFRDPAFVRELNKSGFKARTETVRARGEKGAKHTIFLGTVQASRRPGRSKRSRRS
jgi:spermidine synthase